MAGGCSRGFSLIELMIVIAVLAILTSIAVPSLLAARGSADETVAVATLRHLVTCQQQFQHGARCDVDHDGAGEYGGFLELSGGQAGRQPRVLEPALLSGAFRILNAAGEARSGGYLFRMYLPDGTGAGVGEPHVGFTNDGTVDTDRAEAAWCCYAWPSQAQGADTRAYCANQTGFIIATYDGRYAGAGNGPPPDAAFHIAGSMMGALAVDTPAVDGNVWSPAR